MMRLSTLLSVFALASLVGTAGCSPKIDVQKELKLVDITSGWFDAGIIKTAEGDKNKIVPTVAFKLKNVSDKVIGSVQVFAVYHQVTEKQQTWGETWVKGIGAEGLKPGETTREFVLRSDLGYMGPQPRLQLLQNSQFVDATADILLKQGAQNYVKVAQVPVERQLLTQSAAMPR